MQIWKLEKDTAKKVAGALKKGKVIVCPTDTVYGLLADATNEKALAKVFHIKQRSSKKPFPLFVGNIGMAKRLARISKEQERFLKKVWPGKVTTVLESKRGGTIGLRIPKYRFILHILKIFPRSLTGTSANIAGKEPTRSIEEILLQFAKRKYKPDIIIDAGTLPFSKPSKVVDITGEKIKILRP